LAKNGFPLIIYFFLFFFSGVLFQFYSGKKQTWILVNPGESHPEQRGHGSSRESRGERCEDRKGLTRVHALQLFQVQKKLGELHPISPIDCPYNKCIYYELGKIVLPKFKSGRICI